MKVVSLQYSYDFPAHFEVYAQKITHLVKHHASQGTKLLVFPEYAGSEMHSFAPAEKMQDYLPQYLELFKKLSAHHEILICSGTQVVKTKEGTFNRSYLFSPNGKVSHQDKCNLTPYEVEEGILSPGNTLRLFDTQLGKLAICVCYDIEFPPLARKLVEQGAQLIVVPSYTASVQGYYRVFLSCRARALENQCYVVQSAIVGRTDIEMTYGASAICSPVDLHFPEDGLIALGKRDEAGFVAGSLNFSKLEKVRSTGQTLNYLDAKKLDQRALHFELFDLR